MIGLRSVSSIKSKARPLIVASAVLAFLLMAAGCVKAPVNQPVSAENQPVPVNVASSGGASGDLHKVTKVVDGDTIDADIDGIVERIRLIGINTPETVDPRKAVECFGREASARAKELLDGQSVSLMADSSQGDRDKYGRLLRYVFLADGTNFNLQMIKEGFAYEYTYDLPYEYQLEFRAAAKAAREAGLGLWAKDTCDGQKQAVSSGSAGIVFGATTTLKVGQSVSYADGLAVKLEGINDSRCPQGVQCIWAGELAAVLTLNGGELAGPAEIRVGTVRGVTGEAAPYLVTLVGATTATADLKVTKTSGGQ